MIESVRGCVAVKPRHSHFCAGARDVRGTWIRGRYRQPGCNPSAGQYVDICETRGQAGYCEWTRERASQVVSAPAQGYLGLRRIKVGARLPMDSGAIAQLCTRYRIRKLSLFGSVLKGTDRPDSDVDLLVE